MAPIVENNNIILQLFLTGHLFLIGEKRTLLCFVFYILNCEDGYAHIDLAVGNYDIPKLFDI